MPRLHSPVPPISSVLEWEQDPVASLHDVEREAGDEEALQDLFLVDRLAAQELGVELDEIEDEPFID